MSRTHNQQMADSHERDIAEWIGGTQTKASGSQWHAQMDAKNGLHRVPFPIAGDGKATLNKSIGVSREMWKKAEEQTFGEIPALFLRFYRDETLRTVDLDLVTLKIDTFVRILEAARKWAEHEALTPVRQLLPIDVRSKHGHNYTSTACGHAQLGGGATYLHERCRKTCKFCGEHCNCGCHTGMTE